MIQSFFFFLRCTADQNGVCGVVLLRHCADGADRNGGGDVHALLGGQVLPFEAVEEASGAKTPSLLLS